MLSLRKTYFYIFVFVLLIQIPCVVLVKPLDEFSVLLLLLLSFLDMAVNRNFGRYKYFFVLIGIFTLFLIYTLFWCNFNIFKAVLMDYIIQMKPFVPFVLTYSIAPSFTMEEKSVIKKIAIAVVLVVFATFISGEVSLILGFVTYIGLISFICFIIYMLCSIDEKGKLAKKDIYIAIGILLVGLCSTRAKYFGEFVVAIYFLFLYRPGLFKHIRIKHIIVFTLALAMMFAVSWNKIEYYFIAGSGDTFDVEVVESYARPVLYGTMWLILMDFPFLGSGLASFATISSSPEVHYSGLYYEYGINNVWGLSEGMPLFICDAFYPGLAQFGFVGIALFVMFWMWIYRKLRVVLHKEGKYMFSLGFMIVIYFAIESVAGTAFVQGVGVIGMMLLGMILSKYKGISHTEAKEIYQGEYKDVNNKRLID